MQSEKASPDRLQEIVARFDAQFRHLFVHSTLHESTGLDPKNFIGKTNRELGMPLEWVNRWDAQLAAVFETGRPAAVQIEFSGPRGAVHFCTLLQPEFNAQGRVESVAALACERLERLQPVKSMLEPLTESLHFRAIVESSDDAIISKSLDGIITSWNRGAQIVFGYTAEEMVGRPMLLLFPGDRLTEEDLILERIREGERVDHFETVRVRKDGTQIHVSVTISPILDADGWVIGASKIARDITERKRIEARLQLTSSVFTHSGEAVAITDTTGRIVDVNQAFTTITGYPIDEVRGKDFAFFGSSRQGPEVAQRLLSQLIAHGHCQGEVWSRRKDGTAYAGLLTASAVKDVDGNIQNYVALFADITAVREQQEQLEHVAHFDALTDLPNRLLLSDRLQQAMALAQRNQQTLAVLYLDLDGFKQINDRHGHGVGDELLIAVSQRMKAVMRDVDTLARFGGDEFVAVLVDVHGPAECGLLVDRILQACAETVVLNGVAMNVSASIGVTLYPLDGSDVDQLVRHADRAMYEAKQSGKNRYYVFDPAKDAEFRTRGEQLQRMEEALAQQEFVLHYQPKVNLETGEVIGLEALIRWQHPERGLLAPGTFLPLIERHALSERIGAWVVHDALEQMRRWITQGLRICVSVNVAARQIQHPDFARSLGDMLEAFPEINPGDLELEILETSALEDINAVSGVMHDCRQLGVRFAIDDFGTGYSSLTYLKKLPAECLKIDQSFVRDMLVDAEDLAIVKGIIGLAEAFHRTAIAEGVESLAHGERLLQLGCRFAQGYGIARPMPAEKVIAWIYNWSSTSRFQAPALPQRSAAPLVAIVDDEPLMGDLICNMLENTGVTSEVFTLGSALLRSHNLQRFDTIVLDLSLPDMDCFELMGQLAVLVPNAAILIMSGHSEATVRAADLYAQTIGCRVIGALHKPFSAMELHRLLKLRP